jgi:hypothetical protein
VWRLDPRNASAIEQTPSSDQVVPVAHGWIPGSPGSGGGAASPRCQVPTDSACRALACRPTPSNSPGQHPMDVRLQQVVAGPLIIPLHLGAPMMMAPRNSPWFGLARGRRMGGSWQLRLRTGLHHLPPRLSRLVPR